MSWLDREQERLTTGHYKSVPWAKEPPFIAIAPSDPCAFHFAHPSKDDPALLTYTQSPTKGERDLKTKIKPGAYLKKFFGDLLSEPVIAQWAAKYRAAYVPDSTTLHFAETPDECVAAYKAMTSSCMSYASGGFLGAKHPASVYGSPDPRFVTLTYLKRDGRITAKALVNRTTKHYQSLHGDTTTLTARLQTEGYRAPPNGYCLNGLLLHALPHDTLPDGRQRYIAPCIDGHLYARHDAALSALVLLSHDEYVKLPPADKISLGYYTGLTA